MHVWAEVCHHTAAEVCPHGTIASGISYTGSIGWSEESLTQASIETPSQPFSGKSQEAHQARSCDILHRIKSAKFNWVAKKYAPTHGLIPIYMGNGLEKGQAMEW